MKPLCIYHGNCADGFGAAWVVWRHFKGEVDFFPGVYQNPPPDLTGRDVVIVDFSYKRPVLEEIAIQAHSVLVLDHHKTAAEDLIPRGRFIKMFNATFEGFVGNVAQDLVESADTPVYCVFDMTRSGAGIAWDFFNPGAPRPKLIDHIEDRDLWRFNLPKTREIQANLFSFPYEFELWDRLIEDAEFPGTLEAFAREGAAIERKHHKDIAELVQVTARIMKIGGSHVPAANLPYTMTSDAGHFLCGFDVPSVPGKMPGLFAPHPFACCYMDKPEGRYFSLRSRDDGADVGEIAKLYGGGGHAHAAGFTVPYDQLAQFEP